MMYVYWKANKRSIYLSIYKGDIGGREADGCLVFTRETYLVLTRCKIYIIYYNYWFVRG